MDEKIYSRIANGCVLAAVASAIAFDQAGNYYGIPGAVGIVAGVTATVIYFYNQWCFSSNA